MFKVLNGATAPTRATKYSAMVDLYANADVVMGAGDTEIIPLGVKIDPDFFVYEIAKVQVSAGGKVSIGDGAISVNEFMKSHYIELHPRSSLRAKRLIIGVGVIDLDYPDELGIIVHNPIAMESVMNFLRAERGQKELSTFDFSYTINKGDKIAQCTLVEHKGYIMGIESETERTGGFGSSDNG